MTTHNRTRPRDNQKARVYRAGWDAFPIGGDLPTTGDIHRFVKLVESTPLWQYLTPNHNNPVQVERKAAHGKTLSTAYPRTWRIRIGHGPHHETRTTILHELAHLACYAEHQFTVQPHGPEFCAIYIALLKNHLPDAADRFRLSALTRRVHISQRNYYREALQAQERERETTNRAAF